jgi:hypothetical protein
MTAEKTKIKELFANFLAHNMIESKFLKNLTVRTFQEHAETCPPRLYISTAFNWGKSPESHEYWSYFNTLWEDMYDGIIYPKEGT